MVLKRRLVAAALLAFAVSGGASAMPDAAGGRNKVSELGFKLDYNDAFANIFGSAKYANGMLVFAPKALAVSGGQTASYENLQLTVTALGNNVLSSIALGAEGDYQVKGSDSKVDASVVWSLPGGDSKRYSFSQAGGSNSGKKDWSDQAVFDDVGVSSWTVTLGTALASSGSKANIAFDTLSVGAVVAAAPAAIAPVPEPDSYAMLLAGLGMVGFIVRRRAARR